MSKFYGYPFPMKFGLGKYSEILVEPSNNSNSDNPKSGERI